MNRSVGRSGPENKFIRTIDAEANYVAILHYAILNLLAVHMEAATMASVFQTPALALRNKCGTLAGNAAVVQLQMISGHAAAPNKER